MTDQPTHYIKSRTIVPRDNTLTVTYTCGCGKQRSRSGTVAETADNDAKAAIDEHIAES